MQSSDPASPTAWLRIGTRGSPLALAQAHEVRDRLARAHGVEAGHIVITIIKTTGDAILDRPLSEAGGKGLFTKEIEQALIENTIDIAVHSAKDVPTILPESLYLSAWLPREDVRDVFISPRAKTLAALPAGARVGTASLRRQAMVLRLRPDLNVVSFRGNVQTRLRKLEAGEADATLLALAGLNRLGMAQVATAIMGVDEFLPAVGQGAIAIESRRDDDRVSAIVAAIADADTRTALTCERAFLALLDGSCRTPIGGHCAVDGDRVRFRGQVLSPDGRVAHEALRAGVVADAAALGADAARQLRDEAGAMFAQWFSGT